MVSSISPLFALVIGIDKYLSNEVRDLSGAVADANAGQIKNLRNEEATRVTIEMEIENLGNNLAINKDDPILIFYAGHGAEANAPSGWHSANGKMQMLVPYDFIPSGSSNSQRGQGVLDARLSRLLADLAAKKSDNITVIFDCCHSGSGTRTDDDPTFAVRGIDLPETYTIAQDLLHNIERDGRASIVTKGFEKSGMLSHLQERDGRGAFTSALLNLTLIINLPGLPSQDPQCEGVHRSRCLFNSKVTNRQRKLYPIHASSDTPGQYVLEAGEAHGITKEAEFVVFADRTMASTLGNCRCCKDHRFHHHMSFSSRPDYKKQSFTLVKPGYALQTRVGEGQDVRLLVELDERLLGVFKRIADEMQSSESGKRGFRLVQSRDDKPDFAVAADGDVLHFEIMNELCRQHGLIRMPFEVNIDNSDAIRRVLQSSTNFYWYLHHSSKGSPLAGKVELECMKLEGTGEYTDDLEEILKPDPNGGNLNIGGVISVDVDEEAIYGFKITNTMSVPLYVSMFYFDVSDLSIDSYYQPGTAKKGVDVSLPPEESLTIGYGASGTVPHTYTLRVGQAVDVGFLKVFYSTEGSPFIEFRGGARTAPDSRHLWDTMGKGRGAREAKTVPGQS
ncbi:uncharacterized protein EV420DRAFT_1557705 [Desarmillaria tabescens]|uniref:Peptidase C14 caspase domain-containing protein n=1 Tax=Armillaria tabescens TaxID=1929756 RepID=A0AA39N0R4_ARMTA|nr:uncharacterized protein EV420DRAFT_1557705 [Desarmillaria tabescens]KAK0452945.1 hypothetical protein EV420DRAFT_1557705 [Desarmillaria tabescens]